MTTLLSLTTAVAISGAAMVGSAAAMPAAKLDTNAQQSAANAVQNVHWVCGPYRCWWRPNYYNYYGPRYYNFYGPRWRPYYRRWW
jgi:hypothetical protein